MRMVESPRKYFACEVCGKSGDNETTTGIELDSDITRPIQLCHVCGPIDPELMHLCREITIGCAGN
jgi:hypothetical protein